MRFYSKLLVGLLFMFFLVSCDPSTEYKWKFINKSSSAVSIEWDTNMPYVVQDSSVGAGETKIVFVNMELGGRPDPGEFTQGLGLLVFNATDTLVKDANNKANWSVDTKSYGKITKGYEHEMTFEFTDSDF